MSLYPKYNRVEVWRKAKQLRSGSSVILIDQNQKKGYYAHPAPDDFWKLYTDEDFKKRPGPPSEVFVDAIADDVTDWLNGDPIGWYYWGAILYMDKLGYTSFKIQLKAIP
jgi:hypothetical protein